MLEVFGQIKRDNFQMIVIEKKEDLWPGFKSFLTKDKASSFNGAKGISEGASAALP
jgi:hypothetical protein